MQHSGFHSVVEYLKVLFPIYWSESHSYLYLQLCLWLNLTCLAGTGKIVKTKNLDKAMHDLVFKCSRRCTGSRRWQPLVHGLPSQQSNQSMNLKGVKFTLQLVHTFDQ